MPTDGPRRGVDEAVLELAAEPHRRYNALTGEWVLVSAGRTARPWLGAEEPEPPEERPAYDPSAGALAAYGRDEGPVAGPVQGDGDGEALAGFGEAHPVPPVDRIER